MSHALRDGFEGHKTGVIGTLTLHTAILFVCSMLFLRSTPREDEISEIRVDVVTEEEAEAIEQEMMNQADGVPEKVTNLTSNLTAELKPSFSQAKLAERVEEEWRTLEQTERDRIEQERRHCSSRSTATSSLVMTRPKDSTGSPERGSALSTRGSSS